MKGSVAPGGYPSAGKGVSCSAEEESMPEEELVAWLERMKLAAYAESARSWCTSMGAVSLHEVLENWEDFASELKLKPLEKRRVHKDAEAAGCPAAPEVASPGSGSGSAAAAASGPVAAVGSSGGGGSSSSSPYKTNGNFFGPKDEPQRYLMMEELGSGATATVCKCRRGSDEALFAVKTINLGKLRLQREFQRISDTLHREVSILFTLRHPRIVCLFDVVEEPDRLHLVMEVVDGGDLFDHIVTMGAFTEPVARYVFIQIAEGLKYIHSKDIVYRDLKPENILVDQKASRKGLLEIKLSDFGHSKLVNDGYSIALTRVGTPQYWAPEVSDPFKAAQGYSQSVDLWSLGVVLYVMLLGAYPFDGLAEPIEQQIRKAVIVFRTGQGCHEPSPKAQELIRGLVRFRPQDRLSLNSCLVHPWVATGGGTLGKILKLCTESEPGEAEERLLLPEAPSKEQVELLRRDLQKWTTNFRCSAIVKHGEVVANLQLGLPETERTTAKAELAAIV
ncbi:unnamed protein product, partial [Polarella glacialis]